MFSILESRDLCAERTVLDLFAGAGTLGIEALSRGASAAVFVDPGREPTAAIRDNLRVAGFSGEVMAIPARRAITKLAAAGRRFGGAFLDPPYGEGWVARTLAALDQAQLLVPGGWVVVEHWRDETPPPRIGMLVQTLARRYGDTHVALYEASTDSGGSDGNP